MLYLLPDELLVAIVECCDPTTRKSLSLVSRRLRDPSQSIIFERMVLPECEPETLVRKCASEGGEHRSEVTQNDRLLSYIQTLIISPPSATHCLKMNAAPFIALHRMQRLRDIKLLTVPLTTTMLDQLCEVLSNRLYNVTLRLCSYPVHYTVPQAALKIHKLEYESDENPSLHATTKMLAAIIERSLSSIADLTLVTDLGVLAYFGEMPRLTSLDVLLRSDRYNEELRNFLVANPQLAKFSLEGPFHDLAHLPPSALPNLKTIRACADHMQHLVQDRPVVDVEISTTSRLEFMVDGVRVLSHSAAPIVELALHLHYCHTHLSKILDAVVETIPHLERIRFFFHAEVRNVLY